MRKLFSLVMAVAFLAVLAADPATACCKKKKPPPPPKCPADSSGTVTGAGGGGATVMFGSNSRGRLLSSNGMTNGATQGCACTVVVKKGLGVAATGVTFPAGYPSFSLTTNPTRAANAQAFVDHYLTKAGKNPANFDVYVFDTAPGQTIPGGINFDLAASFSIPAGSDGSELTQDVITLGMFMYDGDEVGVEPIEGGGADPLTLSEYQNDTTKGSLFKNPVSLDGNGLRMSTESAMRVANDVCINGGFDCDMDHNGLVDPNDLRALTGGAVAGGPVSADCAEPADPVPTEPTVNEPTSVPLRLN